MKFCRKCKEYKNEEEFGKYKKNKDGLRNICKNCRKEENKNKKELSEEKKNEIKKKRAERWQEYYKKNKEKILENKKIRDEENKEEKAEYWAEYYEKNKEKLLEKNKTYRIENKEKRKETERKSRLKHRDTRKKNFTRRQENDINFKISNNIRSRIVDIFKRKNYIKHSSFTKSIGCSISFLIRYVELKFQSGMNWENYGKDWQIDHIIPLTAFNLNDTIHFKAACNFRNLQPLWKEENLLKSNRFEEEDFNNYLDLFEDPNE